MTPEEEISREGKGTGSREAATMVLSGRLAGLISNAAERRLGTILRKAIGLRGTHTLRRGFKPHRSRKSPQGAQRIRARKEIARMSQGMLDTSKDPDRPNPLPRIAS